MPKMNVKFLVKQDGVWFIASEREYTRYRGEKKIMIGRKTITHLKR